MLPNLCELAEKYGCDKGVFHSYTPFYQDLLKGRDIKKIVELGVGNRQYILRMKRYGFDTVLGSSLKMWRDFFPKAQVYGADIDSRSMIKEERIKTFLCDETNKDDLENLIRQTGSDIDLFIDDGSHNPVHQVTTCRTLMPLLDRKVIYVIEDVKTAYIPALMEELKEYIVQAVRFPTDEAKDNLVIVRWLPTPQSQTERTKKETTF